MTAILSVLIGLAIIRDPRPRTFVLGVVASVLTIFTWMTQMHERYAYAALVVVLLLIPDRSLRWFAAILAVVITLEPHRRRAGDAGARGRPAGRRSAGDRRVGGGGRPVRAVAALAPEGRGRRTASQPLASAIGLRSPRSSLVDCRRASITCFAASAITTTGAINGTGTARKAVTTFLWAIAGSAIEL